MIMKIYQNLWSAAKALLRDFYKVKHMVLHAYIWKEVKVKINNLNFYLRRYLKRPKYGEKGNDKEWKSMKYKMGK